MQINKSTLVWLIVSVVLLLVLWISTLVFGYKYHKLQEEKWQAEMQELSEANKQLDQVLTDLEMDYTRLEEKHKQTTDLINESGAAINELQDSLQITGNTIKDLKNQQALIRSAVIALIEDYNRILDASSEN